MRDDLIPYVDTVVTAPENQAVSVDYARRHIKAISAAEDVLIRTWIDAATQVFEEETGRTVITTVRERWFDCFPGQYAGIAWPYGRLAYRIELPFPPLQEVVAVEYVDQDGNLATVDDGASPASVLWTAYAPQGTYAPRGWVEPSAGQLWPTARNESGAVRVRYTAGYGDTEEAVPAIATGIICFLVGLYDMYRTPVLDKSMYKVPGVQAAMDAFRYSALPQRKPRGLPLPTDVGVA